MEYAIVHLSLWAWLLNTSMRITELGINTAAWRNSIRGRASTAEIDRIQQDMEDEQQHGAVPVTAANTALARHATAQDLEHALKKLLPFQSAKQSPQPHVPHASAAERAWVRKMAQAAVRKRSK